MSGLALNLFERRFGDLVAIGRARLPSLAPEWTDHNAHDPGITLMELLAWVGEAQLYSLSRLRRDERVAYAALLGLTSAGTRGATGLIWPDRLDPNSPSATFLKSLVIPQDAVINVVGAETPTFRPTQKLLWAPGEIVQLLTRHANGRTSDHTRLNERGGVAYLPFGDTAGRRDVLAMTFKSRDDDGLLGADPRKVKGAVWPIGVIAAPPAGGADIDPISATTTRHTSLAATLITSDRRTPLTIASDSTRGLLTSGTILLGLENVEDSPTEFSIELSSPGGFARPPRVLRIEPNVIPIQQGQSITRESHEANGMPDWSVTLEEPGLRFGAGEEPITLEVAEPDGVKTWRRDRLADQGPTEHVYELDTKTGQVTFGNGLNGRIPPRGAQVLVSYAVCDAERGDIARNRHWHVAGFPGAFGVNTDPITGGASASGWIDQRREARQRSRDDHALVSAADISTAAMALPLLEVVRAWVVTAGNGTPRTGVVRLIAMRSRPDGNEPEQIPETARWLNAIRRQLRPRMPLGSRLAVSAPRYVSFSISANVEGMQGREPSRIEEAITEALARRLALVAGSDGTPPRQPGVPLTRRDIAAWIRAVDGVKRVIDLQLIGPDGKPGDQIRVSRSGLPKWSRRSGSVITVKRPATGSPR